MAKKIEGESDHAVALIRNDFAHLRADLSFQDERIRARCGNLGSGIFLVLVSAMSDNRIMPLAIPAHGSSRGYGVMSRDNGRAEVFHKHYAAPSPRPPRAGYCFIPPSFG